MSDIDIVDQLRADRKTTQFDAAGRLQDYYATPSEIDIKAADEILRLRGGNAKLIAAAPDMLEALSSLENDAGQMPDLMWEMVQDAVAKAGGKRKE